MDWSQHVTTREARLRAGGRRHYNKVRHKQRWARRMHILRVLLSHGCPPGMQTALANAYGVSRATICRDVQALRPVLDQAAPGTLILLHTYGAVWVPAKSINSNNSTRNPV